MIGITRKLPTRQVVTGGIITLAGLALFSLKGSFSISFGMALCLITAFLYAVHIILNNHFVQQHDSLQLGVFQLFFIGFFSLIGAVFTEPIVFPQTVNGWSSLFMLTIFCSTLLLSCSLLPKSIRMPSQQGSFFIGANLRVSCLGLYF